MGIRRAVQLVSMLVVLALMLSFSRLGAQRGAVPASSSAPSTASPELKTLARQSLAQIDGDLNVPGLKDPVEIVRDRWGVPHIYAKSTDDLYFAQGYVIAQDRLWQLEWWRRQREGRLAEVVGPAAFE